MRFGEPDLMGLIAGMMTGSRAPSAKEADTGRMLAVLFDGLRAGA